MMILSVGCQEESFFPATPITIAIQNPSRATQSQKPARDFIAFFTLTVSGPGMETITIIIIIDAIGQSAIFSLSVPNGNNRLFFVQAKNATGKVIFTGSTTVNLNGEPAFIPVQIAPTHFT